MRSRIRRLRFAVYLVFASLALLEFVLQAGHAVVCLTNRPVMAASTKTGASTILCVGDSWTFGIGAEQPEMSYPSQLERMLADRLPDKGWRTVNCGWPGQTSRDVLYKLAAQLDEFEPAVTCVMIGGNDYWARPDLLEEKDAIGMLGHTFEWRFRTGRLIALLIENIRQKFAAPAAPPTGADDASDQTEVSEEGSERAAPQEPPYAYACDATAQEYKRQGWAASTRNDPVTMAECFEKVLAIMPDDPQAHQSLATAYQRLGKLDLAEQHLAWLEKAHAAKPEYYMSMSLLWALQSLGHSQRQHELARQLVEQQPDKYRFWLALAATSMDAGDVAAAIHAVDKSIELHPTPEGYATRARIYGNARDPVEATLSVMQAYLLSKDEQLALMTLRARTDFFTPENYTEALTRLKCSPKRRQALERIGKIAFDGSRAAATEVLRAHLRQIVCLCRAKGSEVVLMSFPIMLPSGENLVAQTMAAVAQELAVVYVDHYSHWREVLATRTWKELSAPDGGHCNGEGYTIMCRLLVKHLIERTRIGR